MRTGKVEWYSDKRGFGILSSPASDGALDKFYCHVSKIVRSPVKIEQGQRCTFEVSDSPLRRPGDLPMALNVVIELNIQGGIDALANTQETVEAIEGVQVVRTTVQKPEVVGGER